MVPKNPKKSIAQHECGFCGQTFESLKYLQIHLNICNNPKINKSGPNNQHGKRKSEDSRQTTSRKINPMGKSKFFIEFRIYIYIYLKKFQMAFEQ